MSGSGRPAKTQPPTVTMPPKPPPVRGAKGRLNLNSKAIKVTLVLDPVQLAELEVPPGAPPQRFGIEAGGRRVTGQLTSKGVRKALAMIAEHGPEKLAVIVQGKLGEGDVVLAAGIIAQPRLPKGASDDLPDLPTP
jgi:hypothetical protein